MALPLTDSVVADEQYVVNVLTIWVTVVVASCAGDEVVAVVVLVAAETMAAKATDAARME